MKKQKSIAVYAFGKHIQELKAKMNGLSDSISFEDFCKISNNIRTSFFMMEALCRIYSKVHGEKPFTKWLKRCKALEDMLGEFDLYTNSILPHADEKEKDGIKGKTLSIFESILALLKEDDWFTGARGKKMEAKLATIVFDEEGEEIKTFFQEEINKIISFHKEITYENMEEHVHEMRRKIRWISIYAQSIQGLVQLKKVDTEQDGVYTKYLTEAVVSSKYNKLPAPTDTTQCIYFNQDAFYAISWLIDELGTIKDEGALILFKKDMSGKLQELLQKAKEICTVFFEKDKILQNLIVE